MLLGTEHITELQQHLVRHHAENGRDGFYFMVPMPVYELQAGYNPSSWNVPPGDDARLWQRVFAWLDERENVRAHVVLSGERYTPHRCNLAAGVEAPYRRRGIARSLMNEALYWLSRWPEVAWVDGWAFAHNEPVLALDYSVGFVEVGRVRDVLRVDGQKLDQVFMVIDLGGA